MIAVITAGGRVDGAFAQAIGTDVKALAPLGSRKLIDTAIDTSRRCGASSITVVGDQEVGAYCGARIDALLPAVADGRANLETALRVARADEPLLLLTSDLPFLAAAPLADFLSRVGDAEIAMPLATPAAYLATYPGAADHTTSLGGERVVNGSVFYFAPGSAPRAVRIARELFAARKSLLRLALLLDARLIARFFLGRLRIRHVEAYAAAHLQIRARAVMDCAPELCYDVDTLDDYRYALEHLGRRG
ncbi:MAG TPA: NTP transferase domain-containing protein [Candidatus Acidoferrales bacterium]|nr:NTP transferase domain-containing protein [Candidatus Acidoferrales bacterium]